MKKGIIDRFEGDIAVIEFDDIMKDIPKSRLPKKAAVGDVLVFDGDRITIDTNEKAKLKQEIEDLMDELFED
ncbi:DUF3006 domain-containing protein [Peribacillus asahii]|uniref:DUF3006 domain-containing protein n=1 Tax=Peribacillus asahii TaxID=228899 RepID=UPI002079F4B0|nr:DUF3006 domain-containing protein [Peribacillus asahii]USK71786.1 DUF3006 domain-containing protein [Peribacillus asahii]